MDLGETMAFIKSRRSMRKFKNEKIDKKQLEQLVEAATWAPSGSNAQAREFIILDDDTIIRVLTAFLPGVLQPPPAIICLCVDYRRENDLAGKLGQEILGVMDIAMAAQNLMLAATAMDIGSCVIRGFDKDVLKVALDLPKHISPELLVILGYPLQSAEAPTRRPLNKVLHWQKFKAKV